MNLKRQDEITTSIQKFTEVAYSRKEVIAAASVLLVVNLAVLGWRLYAASRDANAQSRHMHNVFNDPNLRRTRYQKTLAEAQKTHDAYRGRRDCVVLHGAGATMVLGNTPKATENLQQAIQSGDAEVAGVAKFALAGLYKKHGAKAIDLYKEMSSGWLFEASAAVIEVKLLAKRPTR